MLLRECWWQGNICLFLPSHKFHPHGQAWLSGSSITFLCFNTFWKSLQQLTKWMEVVRHRTSGKVLSHRHILRVTDDDDDCWSLDVWGLQGSLWVSGWWSLVISGDRRQEGETERLTGDRIQLSSDPARIKIGCWELGLSTGGWGGHQWLAAEEQRRRGAQNGG